MALVLTDSKHYHDIAEAIRESHGTDTKYKPEEMASAVREGGGKKLDHTVTFNDENGNTVAIYSVLSGVGNISKPSGVTADKWRDESGAEVSFPLNPTEDIILTADNTRKNSELIYEKQGYAQSEYPYLILVSSATSNSRVYISDKAVMAEESNKRYYMEGGFRYCNLQSMGLNDLIQYCINNKLTFNTASAYSYVPSNSNVATNVKPLVNGAMDIDS